MRPSQNAAKPLVVRETLNNSRARVGLAFFPRQSALRSAAVTLRPSSPTSHSGKMLRKPLKVATHST